MRFSHFFVICLRETFISVDQQYLNHVKFFQSTPSYFTEKSAGRLINSQRARHWIPWTRFESWLWTLCCVLLHPGVNWVSVNLMPGQGLKKLPSGRRGSSSGQVTFYLHFPGGKGSGKWSAN